MVRLYPDDVVSPLLWKLCTASAAGSPDAGGLDEQFYLLLERLVQVHRTVCADIARFPAVRVATRIKLYRRLHLAKDNMDSSFHLPLDVATMAGVAGLSPHHFLRTFRQVFHETPHQYLTRKRLEQLGFS